MNANMSKSAGYSLLEVLVAFAIMMLVLSVLLPAQTNLASSSAVRQERQMAHEYALSKMASLGITAPLRTGEVTGTYQDKWIWEQYVYRNPLSTSEHALFDIRFIVSHNNGTNLVEVTATKANLQ